MPETIFMIHGMWGGSWPWKTFKNYFEEKGYNCITTTLRLHDIDSNEVPPPELGTISISDYVADLEKEIRQLGDKPIVMGHSMGGLLSQILGSQSLAKALILLASAAPAGIRQATPSVIKSFWSILTKWGFWNKPCRQTFEEAVYSSLHLLPPEDQKAIYNKFVYESGRAIFQIGSGLFNPRGPTQVDESKVTCPVLVIAGTQDRITPASIVRKVAKKYKAASTYKEFKNHAHWLIGEPGWEEICDYINGWLDEVVYRKA